MSRTIFKVDQNKLSVRRTFEAPLSKVWDYWTEAALLDQWWAPGPWLSKTKHMDFKEGGHRLYAMISPQGEEHWGRTEYLSIEHHLNFIGEDVFCDENGEVNTDLPVARFATNFNEDSGKTEVTMITQYENTEQLQQIIEMGVKEGLSMTLAQLDGILQG